MFQSEHCQDQPPRFFTTVNLSSLLVKVALAITIALTDRDACPRVLRVPRSQWNRFAFYDVPAMKPAKQIVSIWYCQAGPVDVTSSALNRDELKELPQTHESRFFAVEISSLFANFGLARLLLLGNTIGQSELNRDAAPQLAFVIGVRWKITIAVSQATLSKRQRW
jgi:hypothetical protein